MYIPNQEESCLPRISFCHSTTLPYAHSITTSGCSEDYVSTSFLSPAQALLKLLINYLNPCVIHCYIAHFICFLLFSHQFNSNHPPCLYYTDYLRFPIIFFSQLHRRRSLPAHHQHTHHIPALHNPPPHSHSHPLTDTREKATWEQDSPP